MLGIARSQRSSRARKLLLAVSAGVACLVAASGYAQDYPVRPIRIIVPFSAGGAVDGPTRLIAQELAKRIGQPVYVENKPGAGATIGSEIAAKAAPDGYTLLLASQTNAISATLYSKLPFDPVEDFAPICLLGREPGVLVVNPAFPAKTIKELIAYAKQRPGEVNFASSGNGSGQHLFAAMFASMAGLKLRHIPYRGSAQATADVVAGRVPMYIPGMAGVMGLIKAGKLRPLAVTGTTRSPELPDVPTLAESGLPNYSAYVWLGLLAPKGTPAPIIAKLNRELVAVLAMPTVKAYMNKGSIEVVGSTPAEFGKYFREEKQRWAGVIKETGAHVN
ncbi:tripartite tricarboxylate transporter family receptor [mine drainage metagenome]|uniref:Tripartite tricarboxylate transporter family receptor n=1 Tax=mine drainage metagenome TaxID=410659 RepID=A0A1J5R5F3_9ZZZZ